MSIFYCDGYQIDGNPGTQGGATVVRLDDNKVYKSTYKRDKVTNNEVELDAAILAAVNAKKGDTIITDSKLVVLYGTRDKTRAKSKFPELKFRGKKLSKLLKEKELNIIWEPRDNNLAGIYNAEMYG